MRVFRDELDNIRLETAPQLTHLEDNTVFVYNIAYRKDYLLPEGFNFNHKLIPRHLTVSKWKAGNAQNHIYPAETYFERDILMRLTKRKKYQWFNGNKNNNFLPAVVNDALEGKDVAVYDVLKALSDDFCKYKDAVIPIYDEFNSFTESMVHFRSGVCRHRARAAFMVLNTIGIPARLAGRRSRA